VTDASAGVGDVPAEAVHLPVASTAPGFVTIRPPAMLPSSLHSQPIPLGRHDRHDPLETIFVRHAASALPVEPLWKAHIRERWRLASP
jgi:hypothetical protein